MWDYYIEEITDLCKFVLFEDHYQTKYKKHQTMPNVTEHYTEQKGKSNGSEEGWIGLTISCSSIGLDNLLSRTCVRVALE
jgi:hypothetical protein